MTLHIYRPPFSMRSGCDILGQKTASMFASNGINCKVSDLWPEFLAAIMHAGIIPFGVRFFSKAIAPIFAMNSMKKIQKNDLFWLLGSAVPLQETPYFELKFKNLGAKYIYHIMDDWFEFDYLRKATILRAELSDLIVVPTPTLFQKVKTLFPSKKIVILEEPIDVSRVYPIADNAEKTDRIPIIVWTGNTGNINMLQPINNILEKLSKRIKFRLRVISKLQPTMSFECDWEWRKYDFLNESQLLAGAAAGLTPIQDTPHDRAKGVYKVKTYLAAGIAPVGPPIGYLNHLVESNQNGFLCKTEDEWIDCLYLLLSNYDERRRISKYARECAVGKYSHSAVSSQWVNAIKVNFPLAP